MKILDSGLRNIELKGLSQCSVVLDVGAGIRPMNWYKPDRHICIEPYGPYADVLEAHGYEVLRGTALEKLCEAEAIYLIDVIEHMEREEGEEVIRMAQSLATDQVVVLTPNGFRHQDRDDWGMGGDHWQRHRSGWTPSDFPGWRIQHYRKSFFATWDAR